MGVKGFFPWVKSLGYQPIPVNLQSTDSFIVDAKLLMFKKASAVPINCSNVAQAIADKIINSFSKFENVLFVNDGIDKIPTMKCSEVQKRKNQKIKNQDKANEEKEKLNVLKDKKRKRDEEETNLLTKEEQETRLIIEDLSFALKEEAVEQRLRNARGVSTELSMEVLKLLKSHGFKTIQCDGEADPVLVELAPSFTYLVSEDSDFLVSGATNLLRGFGLTNLLYNSNDILAMTPFNSIQLKQMACMSGCDYTEGLNRVQMPTADKLLRQYKNFDVLVEKLDYQKYSPCANFKETILKGVELYSRKEAYTIE